MKSGIYYTHRMIPDKRKKTGGGGQKHDLGTQKVMKGMALEFKGMSKPTQKVVVRQALKPRPSDLDDHMIPPPRKRGDRGSYYKPRDQRGGCRRVL